MQKSAEHEFIPLCLFEKFSLTVVRFMFKPEAELNSANSEARVQGYIFVYVCFDGELDVNTLSA